MFPEALCDLAFDLQESMLKLSARGNDYAHLFVNGQQKLVEWAS
jgi:hypothetical protein